MTLLTPDLNPRQKQILTALVDHYIVRAEPVSSSLLSQSAVVRASSATIRNTLADLEERGFVEQPHTSSGRLPTDRGYRTYVDELMHPEPLGEDDRRALDVAIPSVPESGDARAGTAISMESRLAGAAKGLADQTGLLGLVVPPPDRADIFRKVSLVEVEENRVALILTSGDQSVRSLLIDSREVSIFRLEAVVKRLNDSMRGRSVSGLNDFFGVSGPIHASGDEKVASELLGRSILKLTGEKSGEDVFLAGAKNLLNREDFGKTGEIESIFELLESKVTLVHFLRQREDTDGVHVTIGEERGPDGRLFRSLSLVTAAFTTGEGHPRGMVGVLGPKRMPYARLVPMIHYAAKRLSPASPDGGER
jgi:heat-inducible transcriptional repressor